MITYIEKDKVLFWLCEQDQPESMVYYSLIDLQKQTGLAFNEINAVFAYFHRKQLISSNTLRRSATTFPLIVYTEAFDLYKRGGFTVVEEQLSKNLEKLNLELEELRSDFPEKTAKSFKTV